jgi:hypothetical protein
MHGRIDRLDMLGIAASGIATAMMDVMAGRPMQGLIDEAMRSPQRAIHTDMTVSVSGA